MGRGHLLFEGFVGPFVVVFVHEVVKSALLGSEVFCWRLGRGFFECAVHAFVPTVFLRLFEN